jgi:hypothetical protein
MGTTMLPDKPLRHGAAQPLKKQLPDCHYSTPINELSGAPERSEEQANA